MADRRQQDNQDHDLLIEINTKLERVIDDVKELKDNFSARVETLENEKVNKKDFEDFREEVRPIINNYWKAVGIIGFILAALTLWIAYLQAKGH